MFCDLGKNCELPNFCYPSPCFNEGTCMSLSSGYECNCQDTGYSGDNCLIDIGKYAG